MFLLSLAFLPSTLTHCLPQLKVKPKRTAHVQACALELTAMLSCWASAGDLVNAKECRDSAKRLHECMAKPVRLSSRPLPSSERRTGPFAHLHDFSSPFPRLQTVGGRAKVSTVNYHLSKL